MCLCTRITLTIKKRKEHRQHRQPPRSLPIHPPYSPKVTIRDSQPVNEFFPFLSRFEPVPRSCDTEARGWSRAASCLCASRFLDTASVLPSPQPWLATWTDHSDFPILSWASIWAVSGFEECGVHPRTVVRMRFCWGHTSGTWRLSSCPPWRRRPSAVWGRCRCAAPHWHLALSLTLATWLYDGVWLWLHLTFP